MGRMAAKKPLVLAALLVAAASAAHGAEGRARTAAKEPASGYRLDEIRIVGSSERPQVLFFLPRSRFRLLPARTPDLDVKNRLLMDDKASGAGE